MKEADLTILPGSGEQSWDTQGHWRITLISSSYIALFFLVLSYSFQGMCSGLCCPCSSQYFMPTPSAPCGPRLDKKAPYPSVILELGWHKSAAVSANDTRVWQVGSSKAVRVILLLNPFRENPMRVQLSINRTSSAGALIAPKHYTRTPLYKYQYLQFHQFLY